MNARKNNSDRQRIRKCRYKNSQSKYKTNNNVQVHCSRYRAERKTRNRDHKQNRKNSENVVCNK